MFRASHFAWALAKRPYVRKPNLLVPKMPCVRISALNLSKLSNRDFGMYFLNSIDTAGCRELGETGIAESIQNRVTLMTPKDMYRTLMGLARCNVLINEKILTVLVPKIQIDSSQLCVHEIGSLSVEIAACLSQHETIPSCIHVILKSLSESFSKKIAAANPIDLANMATAVAELTPSGNLGLFDLIAKSALVQIAQFKGPELVDLLLAFSKTHHPEFRDLFTGSLTQLNAKIKLLDPQHLKDVEHLRNVAAKCGQITNTIDLATASS